MLKPRLQRLPLLFTDHPVYFLTACTLHRRSILANRVVHDTLTSFATKAADNGVFVGRYVIMPDHVHIFAGFVPGAPTVSVWMKALKRTLAKERSQAGFGTDCWQKGFFDHLMRSEESYSQKWRYVKQNPVRAGLVTDADEWPYQGEIYRLEVKGT